MKSFFRGAQKICISKYFEEIILVSGGCLDGVFRVSGGYLWDVRMVCGGV